MSKAIVPCPDKVRGLLQCVCDGQERIVDLITKDSLDREDLFTLRLHAKAYQQEVDKFVRQMLEEISRQNLVNTANANRDEARKGIITRAEIEAARVAS